MLGEPSNLIKLLHGDRIARAVLTLRRARASSEPIDESATLDASQLDLSFEASHIKVD